MNSIKFDKKCTDNISTKNLRIFRYSNNSIKVYFKSFDNTLNVINNIEKRLREYKKVYIYFNKNYLLLLNIILYSEKFKWNLNEFQQNL